LISF
jgi:hypothetical protein